MKKPIYIVSETAFEYNDSYYHIPECGGVLPKYAFDTLEKARKYKDKQSIKWAKINLNPLENYTYEQISSKEIEAFFEENNLEFNNEDDMGGYHTLPEDITDEVCLKLLDFIDTEPYTINKIEYL